jgi:hypothetical protein
VLSSELLVMVLKTLRKERVRCGAVVLLVGVATAVVSLLGGVVWRNLVGPLGMLQGGRECVVGETFVRGMSASNGVAPGVLADLTGRSQTAQWVGGIYQTRSEIGRDAAFRDEVVSYVTPELARRLRLVAGAIPDGDDRWLAVAGDQHQLGDVIEVNGQARTVVALLGQPLTFPRLRSSRYVVPFRPKLESRGGGRGYLVAQPAPGVSARQLMSELEGLMAGIRRERIEDSQTTLVLRTASEFAAEYGQGAFVLGSVLVSLLAVALLMQLGLLAGLGIAENRGNWRVMMQLEASQRQAVAPLVMAYALAAVVGGGVGMVLARVGVWWLSERSPWMVVWPGNAELAGMAMLGAVISVAVMVTFIVTGSRVAFDWRCIGQGRQRLGWTSTVAAFLLVTAAVWLSLSVVPIDRKIEDFLEKPKGFGRGKLFFVEAVGPKGLAEWKQLRERVAQQPMVACAALGDHMPLTSSLFPYDLHWEGRKAEVMGVHVGEGYRECMGMRLREGRELPAEAKVGGRTPVLVSETAARRLFPGVRPVGQLLESQYRSRGVMEVVGVVEDSQQLGLEGKLEGQILLAVDYGAPGMLAVRTKGAMGVGELQQLLAREGGKGFRFQVQTVETLERRELARELFHQRLLQLIGGTVLVVAGIGVGAAVFWLVASGRKGMAIRIALGATAERALGALVIGFVWPVVGGLVFGAFLTIQSAEMLDSYLAGLDYGWRWDYLAPVGVVVGWVVLSLAPAWWQARRTDAARLLTAPEN